MNALIGSLAIIIVAFCSFFSKPGALGNAGGASFADCAANGFSAICAADLSAVYAVQPACQTGFVQKLRKHRRNFLPPQANMCFEASGILSVIAELPADLFYAPFLSDYGGKKTPLFTVITASCGEKFIPAAKVLLI